MSNLQLNTKVCSFIILAVSMSRIYAADCDVASFVPNDNQSVRAGVGTIIPRTNLANVPIYSSTERCAQILIQCKGYGSTIVESDGLTAQFADGKEKKGTLSFDGFRLHGGESKTVYTCFGSSKAPIVSIKGRL